MDLNHPGIVRFGHHHRAMFHCETEAQLDAVWVSITRTVKPDDEELPLLRTASKARRIELKELARLKAVKPVDETEKLIIRELPTDDNVRSFSKK